MFNRAGKVNWLVLVVFLLGILSSLAWAAAEGSPDSAATEQKISIIPEPVTLLVLLAGLMLFSWKHSRKSRHRSVASGTRD